MKKVGYQFENFSVEVTEGESPKTGLIVFRQWGVIMILYEVKRVRFSDIPNALHVELLPRGPYDLGSVYHQSATEWFFRDLLFAVHQKTVEEWFRGGYKILLSEKQLSVYREALEMYSRLLSGQADMVRDLVVEAGAEKPDADRIYKELEDAIRKHHHSDIDGSTEKRGISYDMYREVHHYWAKESRDGIENVYSRRNLISREPCPEVLK
jgi:hypothetical protein